MDIDEFKLRVTRLINESHEPLHKKGQLREALAEVVETCRERPHAHAQVVYAGATRKHSWDEPMVSHFTNPDAPPYEDTYNQPSIRHFQD